MIWQDVCPADFHTAKGVHELRKHLTDPLYFAGILKDWEKEGEITGVFKAQEILFKGNNIKDVPGELVVSRNGMETFIKAGLIESGYRYYSVIVENGEYLINDYISGTLEESDFEGRYKVIEALKEDKQGLVF